MVFKEYQDLENKLVELGHDMYLLGYKNADEHRLKALRQLRRDISLLKEDAEIKYGHQLGFDKIYAYEQVLKVIDRYTIEEVSVE